MASTRVKNEEMELNLNTVKELTQQIKSFGFENAGDPIFQWRFVSTIENLKRNFGYTSDLFLLNHSDLKARLNMTILEDYLFKPSGFKLSLKLNDWEQDVQPSMNRDHFFACKLKLCYRNEDAISEKCLFSINAFNFNDIQNEFNFYFDDAFEATTIAVELYQETLAMMEYRSPFQNTVVGKMERVKEMMEKTDFEGFLYVSPRFDVGAIDQLMVVSFKYVNFPLVSTRAIGLNANLNILSPSGLPPFSFAVTYTMFSQMEDVKDSICKVFYRQDENKSDFSTLLAFGQELAPFVENDTLYYKVVIKPCPAEQY